MQTRAKYGDRLFKELIEYNLPVARRSKAHQRLKELGGGDLMNPERAAKPLPMIPECVAKLLSTFLERAAKPLPTIPERAAKPLPMIPKRAAKPLTTIPERVAKPPPTIPKCAAKKKKQLGVGIKYWLGLLDRYEKGEQLLNLEAWDFKIVHMLHAWQPLFKDPGIIIDHVVVDEGSALFKSEVLSCLHPDVKKMIIFEDRLQLGLTITQPYPESQPAAWNVLEKSSATRTIPQLHPKENFQLPKFTLDVVNSVLPRSDRLKLAFCFASGGAVVHLVGCEARPGRNLTSKVNHDETNFVSSLVEKIRAGGKISDAQIRDSNPSDDKTYNEFQDDDVYMPWSNAPLPQMVTAQASRHNELHIGVIDSIQGGERDYMVYSYVGGENSGGAIGFTSSANRLYMAATQMIRGGCWVLNAEVFLKVAIVGPIIAAAKCAGSFFEFRAGILKRLQPEPTFLTPKVSLKHVETTFRSINSHGERQVLEWQPVHHARLFWRFPPEETAQLQRTSKEYKRFVKLKGHILLHDPQKLLSIPDEREAPTLPTGCQPPGISRAGDYVALSNIKTRLARESANADLRFSQECSQEN
ncbi:hypothetical protein DFJ77DRAFT_437501 [Powellomyces hirtus]|nr:hypothetical protein DFJ77DRAFT_437501 [Powellomyces hirtus]